MSKTYFWTCLQGAFKSTCIYHLGHIRTSEFAVSLRRHSETSNPLDSMPYLFFIFSLHSDSLPPFFLIILLRHLSFHLFLPSTLHLENYKIAFSPFTKTFYSSLSIKPSWNQSCKLRSFPKTRTDVIPHASDIRVLTFSHLSFCHIMTSVSDPD